MAVSLELFVLLVLPVEVEVEVAAERRPFLPSSNICDIKLPVFFSSVVFLCQQQQ